MALDPAKYFIIIPNMLGNGLSSSPSNTPEPYNGPRFPLVTAYDNVRAQHRLVTEKFGIEHIRLVIGWSMGALQTFHWGALYPDMMDLHRCRSAARPNAHATISSSSKASRRRSPPTRPASRAGTRRSRNKGLRAAARVYAGWGFSQAFYRQKLDIEAMGYSSLEDFLVAFWEGFFLPKDANNLLTMLWTWQNGDISDNEIYKGDFAKALGAIKAKAYVMPGETDLYFPPADSEFEVRQHAQRQARPDSLGLGPFRRRPGHQSEGRRLSRCQGERACRSRGSNWLLSLRDDSNRASAAPA